MYYVQQYNYVALLINLRYTFKFEINTDHSVMVCIITGIKILHLICTNVYIILKRKFIVKI